jgi:hypothetical protein
MRKSGDKYVYVAVYGDNLSIAMKDSQEFIKILETVHGFKTKGT